MAIDWDRLVLKPTHAVFGEPADISWGGGAAITVPDAVFDNTVTEIVYGDGRAPSTVMQPTLGIRQAALPEGVDIRQGDRVLVRGTPYRVQDVRPDALGHLLLVLSNG